MQKFLGHVALDRLLGSNPSPLRALAASAVAGVAVAGMTYRVLRHGDDGADE
jgi:hypothetical protein